MCVVFVCISVFICRRECAVDVEVAASGFPKQAQKEFEEVCRYLIPAEPLTIDTIFFKKIGW